MATDTLNPMICLVDSPDEAKTLQLLFDLENYFFSAVNEITALANAFEGLLSSAAFLSLRRLKIIQLVFSWFFLSAGPKAMSDSGVSSKAAAYLGFLQQQPGWRGRMETAICAWIYPHGVSCEPKCWGAAVVDVLISVSRELPRPRTTHEHCGVDPPYAMSRHTPCQRNVIALDPFTFKNCSDLKLVILVPLHFMQQPYNFIISYLHTNGW